MGTPIEITPRGSFVDRIGLADLLPYRHAADAWYQYRCEAGFLTARASYCSMPDANHKLALAEGTGVPPTLSLALAPANTAGVGNLCPMSTPACRECCIRYTGLMLLPKAQFAGEHRTRFMAENPSAAWSLAFWEVQRYALRHGARVGFRGNAVSDNPIEDVAPWIFDAWRDAGADVAAYDYTKLWNRDPRPHPRYKLTYSASERTTDDDIRAAVADGRNVAVVMDHGRGGTPPRKFLGCRVIDGDRHDYRYGDPRGVVVALFAKGRAAKLTPGGAGSFVRSIESGK